jgi:exodeoxyribonuclease III
MKMEFLSHFMDFAMALKEDGKPTIITGDFNICHLDIDIHNPDKQHNTSGFLPEERSWVTQLLSNGYADAFREIHPSLRDTYSWWSYRAGSKARNKGWRIDYHMVSETMIQRIIEAEIESKWDMSDHAPVTITYRF